MSNGPRAFTKAVVDQFLTLLNTARSRPTIAPVSRYIRSVFVIYDTTPRALWNWRRTKRELRRIGLVRKGVRREYHKRAA